MLVNSYHPTQHHIHYFTNFIPELFSSEEITLIMDTCIAYMFFHMVHSRNNQLYLFNDYNSLIYRE
jgi:hypothetical protein